MARCTIGRQVADVAVRITAGVYSPCVKTIAVTWPGKPLVMTGYGRFSLFLY